MSVLSSNSMTLVKDVIRSFGAEAGNTPAPNSKINGASTVDENQSFNAVLDSIKATGSESAEIKSNFGIASMAVAITKSAGEKLQTIIKN
jgi:hypothetical protein